ncbi:MAG: hypothetical protein KA436_10695 [Oligoflexales bacterium]|nr:hypothetical protein [Oligoflexales bacterium]
MLTKMRRPIQILSISFSLFCSFFPAQAENHRETREANDLRSLAQKWQDLEEKTELASSLIRVQMGQFEDGEWAQNSVIQEMARVRAEGKVIRSLNYQTIKEDSRDILLKSLYNSKEPSKFCQSFDHSSTTVKKKDKKMNTDELEKEMKKARNSQCKKQTADLLGGVLHTDPEILLFEIDYTGEDAHEETELVSYIRSSIDPSRYLRYSFMMK